MYYFDDNQIKVFVNESIGTIDYTTGKVTISELAILDVLNDFKQLSIHAKPENTVFESNQNKILTLNYDDPESISVRLTPISK
jgi:hypothetical protein